MRLVITTKLYTEKQARADAKDLASKIRRLAILADAYRGEGEEKKAQEVEVRLQLAQNASIAIVTQVDGIRPSREVRHVLHETVIAQAAPLMVSGLRTAIVTAAKNTRRSLVHFVNDDQLVRATVSQVFRRDGVDADGRDILVAVTGHDYNNTARITPYMVKDGSTAAGDDGQAPVFSVDFGSGNAGGDEFDNSELDTLEADQAAEVSTPAVEVKTAKGK